MLKASALLEDLNSFLGSSDDEGGKDKDLNESDDGGGESLEGLNDLDEGSEICEAIHVEDILIIDEEVFFIDELDDDVLAEDFDSVDEKKVKVIRGGKVVSIDVDPSDMKKKALKRKKLKGRRTGKRRGKMSAATKAKIAKALKNRSKAGL